MGANTVLGIDDCGRDQEPDEVGTAAAARLIEDAPQKERSMTKAASWLISAGLTTGLFAIGLAAQPARVVGQRPEPLFMTRIYSGADGQSHAERIEVTFPEMPNGRLGLVTLMGTSGAELLPFMAPSPTPSGRFGPENGRKWVITIAGQADIDVAGGKTVHFEPGDIQLLEDTSGKGHSTRRYGVMLRFPVSDQYDRMGPGTSTVRPGEKGTPLFFTHFYPGDEGSGTQQIEVTFARDRAGNDVFKMIGDAGAEMHRFAPHGMGAWHTAPQRQYLITLRGHGEMELADGTRVQYGPGTILLIEDTTGKGHRTRISGTEDLVTLTIPISDPPAQ
jgi:cupin domain